MYRFVRYLEEDKAVAFTRNSVNLAYCHMEYSVQQHLMIIPHYWMWTSQFSNNSVNEMKPEKRRRRRVSAESTASSH